MINDKIIIAENFPKLKKTSSYILKKHNEPQERFLKIISRCNIVKLLKQQEKNVRKIKDREKI